MLKITAVLFLLLAGTALEASGAEGSSGVPMREIDAGEILAKVREGQPVEYDHVVVRGDLDLSRERLQRNITSSIRINDSIFDGEVSFNGTTLEKPVDLSGSNFIRDAYFMGAMFSGVAGFGGAMFSGVAGFGGAVFNGDASFLDAEFIGVTDFSEAKFSGDADFEYAAFSNDADVWNGWRVTGYVASFYGAAFNGHASFMKAAFNGHASFMKAAFNGDAGFGGAAFNGDADFVWTAFNGDASFVEAAFNGDASFGGAAFNGDADFRWTAFSGYTDFEWAAFIGNSSFQDAEFNGNIEFGYARFENDTSFYRILFKRPAYFENSFIESLNLTKAEYSRLHLRWDDIESLHFDEAAYLALIKNYNNLGWYGDANDCYFAYRNAVRENWQAASSSDIAARLSNFFDRLTDFGEWLLYGYGVKPSFPIAWSVGIILAFGLFFRRKRCLRKIITEEKIEDAGDGSDEVLVESKARKAPINSLDPFLFSLFTFTSGFTAFLHPAVEYKLESCLRWAIAERLLGPFFLALVITTISKTYLIR